MGCDSYAMFCKKSATFMVLLASAGNHRTEMRVLVAKKSPLVKVPIYSQCHKTPHVHDMCIYTATLHEMHSAMACRWQLTGSKSWASNCWRYWIRCVGDCHCLRHCNHMSLTHTHCDCYCACAYRQMIVKIKSKELDITPKLNDH